jgi:hypothetical protein
MTLYPNIICKPDIGAHIFLDTLQSIVNPRYADVVEYTSAVDGKPYSFTRDRGQRGTTLNCKIDTDNENNLRRQIDSIIGEQVYLMMGAEELATLAKIRSYSFQKAVGTYTPLTLDVVCDGSSEGQFYEAEDCTYMGSEATSASSSGGWSVYLSAAGEFIKFNIFPTLTYLPEGDYRLFARAYDTNQVTDDFGLVVYKRDDSTLIASTTTTLTPYYAVKTLDFTIDSADVGDEITMYAQKETTTPNNIHVDYLGFVRTD